MPYRAQTEIEAANLALGEIGEPPIGTLQDNSARARACLMWFGQVRDELQRSHDWGFCSAWIVPAMDPTPALGDFKNRFVLPEDCLGVRDARPYQPAGQQPVSSATPSLGSGWTIEAVTVNPNDTAAAASVLVTNMTQPIVNYSRRIIYPRLWDPIFTEAFAKELAARIAPKIAKDIGAGEKKHAEGRDIMDDASRNDSREESPRHISRETSWVRSRFSGYARPWGPWGRG